MYSIKFFGATGCVTGSSYFLFDEVGKGILVDFGMFQEVGQTQHNTTPLPLDAKNIAGVFLTHAHLDHCGRLPMLIRMGYFGKIYMTEPTKLLIELSLMDAVRVAQDSPKDLLYTEDDVVQMLRQVEIVQYEDEIKVGDFAVTFWDAGHILGSALLEVVTKKDSKRIIFSGDLGNTPHELLQPTATIPEADVVIMESTYGGSIHPEEDTNGIIQREINAIEKSEGTLLLPAFSLDRTQELLHKINHFKHDEKVSQETPVFLDSPMGIHATLIYKEFPQIYNQELSEHAKREDPFNFPNLAMVDESRDSRKIKLVTGPKVIIAGSGMMSGGRILRHAAVYLPLVTTHLLLTGYQAEGTLGRKIQDGLRRVILDDHSLAVNATVTSIEGMSAHADQPKLLAWLKHIRGVKKVFLTHGENDERKALFDKVREAVSIEEIILPQMNEVIPV